MFRAVEIATLTSRGAILHFILLLELRPTSTLTYHYNKVLYSVLVLFSARPKIGLRYFNSFFFFSSPISLTDALL